jgi:hypothetical protein
VHGASPPVSLCCSVALCLNKGTICFWFCYVTVFPIPIIFASSFEIFQIQWVFTILLVPQTKELAGLSQWFQSFLHPVLYRLSLQQLFSSPPQPQSQWGSRWHTLPVRSVYCFLTLKRGFIFTCLHHKYVRYFPLSEVYLYTGHTAFFRILKKYATFAKAVFFL